jgi:hypothetical protein
VIREACVRSVELQHGLIESHGRTLLQEIDGNEQLMSAAVLNDHALQARQRPNSNTDLCSGRNACFPADGQTRRDKTLDLPEITQQLLCLDDRESTQDTFRL